MADQGPVAEQQLSQATKQQSLRRPLRWAVGAHIALMLVAYFGMPHFKEKVDLTQAVSVDLVAPTGDISSAPNTTKHKQPFKPMAKPIEQKKPVVAKTEKPPAPVQTNAAPKQEVPKPEEKKLEKPKKVEPPKKDAMEKVLENIKKDKVEKKKKTKDDNKAQAEQQQDMNALLKNLLGDPTPVQEEGNPINAPVDTSKQTEGTAPTTSDVLALSEMDALKYQLAKCWNFPAGAMNAEDLIVDIRVEVNPDRTVKSAEIVDTGRYNSDDFFRAAADSAKRAVYNPMCTPLALPPEKYDVWKKMLIRFNPREMFGG